MPEYSDIFPILTKPSKSVTFDELAKEYFRFCEYKSGMWEGIGNNIKRKIREKVQEIILPAAYEKGFEKIENSDHVPDWFEIFTKDKFHISVYSFETDYETPKKYEFDYPTETTLRLKAPSFGEHDEISIWHPETNIFVNAVSVLPYSELKKKANEVISHFSDVVKMTREDMNRYRKETIDKILETTKKLRLRLDFYAVGMGYGSLFSYNGDNISNAKVNLFGPLPLRWGTHGERTELKVKHIWK